MTSSTAWERTLILRTNNRSDSLENGRRLVPASIQIPSVAGSILSFGDPGILKARKLALFCSVKCPGDPILQTYDLARSLRDAGVNVIGGFQSPIEKDCLELLLRGTQPVIMCPARSFHTMRLPSAWKTAVAQGRLLLLSPFEERFRRPTTALADKRNEFVASLADEVLFAYAEPGGKLEALAKKVIASGKPVLTLDSKENAHLVSLGAKPIRLDAFVSQLAKERALHRIISTGEIDRDGMQ